jgi:DNA-binding CsgD family transcriptional regulator
MKEIKSKTTNTWLGYMKSMSSEVTLNEDLKNFYIGNLISMRHNFLPFFFYNIPMIYMLDYTTGRYITMSDSALTILGHRREAFMEGGIQFTVDCYQPDHFGIFNQEIFPDRLQMLRKIHPDEHHKYVFSYNFAFRNNQKVFGNLLQRNIFIKSDAMGNPLISIGVVINIDHYEHDGPTVQTIEKIDNSSSTSELVFSSKYYLHNIDRLFSHREKDVLYLLAAGLTSKEIGGKLFISEGTVIIHRKSMLEKAGVPNVAALVAYAIRNRII